MSMKWIAPVLVRRTALAAGIGLGSVACGDPCEDAVERLCEKACECPGTGECSTAFGDNGEGISLGFASAEDCATLFRAGCEDGVEDQIDGEACDAQVDGATCGENGLIVPAACGGGG